MHLLLGKTIAVMVHNYMGQVPFLLTSITAITIYGITLSVYAANFGSRWADWYFAIWSWVLSLFVFVVSGLYAYKLVSKRVEAIPSFWGFIDMYIALLHAIAALGMSIFALDTTRVAHIAPVTGASPYAVFVADYLVAVVHVVNTAGYVNTKPVTGSVIGGIWGMFMSIIGWLLLAFIFAFVLLRNKRRRDQDMAKMKESKVVNVGLVPDYGLLVRHGKGAKLRAKHPGPNHTTLKMK